MEHLPGYVYIVFTATTLITVLLLYKAGNSRAILITLLFWLALQSIVSLTGFYVVSNTMPPRLPFLILPPLVLIAGLFVTKRGRQFIDRFDVRTLTLLHTVRIPVELTLYWLCLHKAVPQLITFEGTNFDIFSGLTAPIVYYFGYVRHSLGKKTLIAWNIVCLLLLANVVVTAILSAPVPFQRFAFNQPNIAILYFPFIWLPCCIVPVVLFAHLASLRKLAAG